MDNGLGVTAKTDDGRRTTDDGRRTTDDGRRTTDDGRRTTDDGRRTTDDGRRTTDDGLRTADCGLRTGCCCQKTNPSWNIQGEGALALGCRVNDWIRNAFSSKNLANSRMKDRTIVSQLVLGETKSMRALKRLPAFWLL